MGPATETADPRRDSPLRRVATAPTREEAAAAEGPTPLRTRQCFSSVLSRSSAQLIPKTEPRAQTACRLNSRCPRAPEADDNNDSLLLLPESRRPKTTRRSRRHFPNAGSHDPRYSPSHWLRTAEKGDVTSRARLPPPPQSRLRIFVVGLAFGGQTRQWERDRSCPFPEYERTRIQAQGDSLDARLCVVIQPDV